MIKKFKFKGSYVYDDEEKFLCNVDIGYGEPRTPKLLDDYSQSKENFEDYFNENLTYTLEQCSIFEGVKFISVEVTNLDKDDDCVANIETDEYPSGGHGDYITYSECTYWEIKEYPYFDCEGILTIDDVDDKFEKNYDSVSFLTDFVLTVTNGEDDGDNICQEYIDNNFKFERIEEEPIEDKLEESLNETSLELSYPSVLAEIEDLYDCFNNECKKIYGTDVVPMSIMAKPENIKKTEEFVNDCENRVKNLRNALKAMGMLENVLNMCINVNKQDYTIMKTDLLKRIYAFVKAQAERSKTITESLDNKTPDDAFLAKLRELTSENLHPEARKMIADKYFGENNAYSVMLQSCIDIIEKNLWQYKGITEAYFHIETKMCEGMFEELEKKIGKDNVKLIRSCL